LPGDFVTGLFQAEIGRMSQTTSLLVRPFALEARLRYNGRRKR